jgi:hypothetical protein
MPIERENRRVVPKVEKRTPEGLNDRAENAHVALL